MERGYFNLTLFYLGILMKILEYILIFCSIFSIFSFLFLLKNLHRIRKIHCEIFFCLHF